MIDGNFVFGFTKIRSTIYLVGIIKTFFSIISYLYIHLLSVSFYKKKKNYSDQ